MKVKLRGWEKGWDAYQVTQSTGIGPYWASWYLMISLSQTLGWGKHIRVPEPPPEVHVPERFVALGRSRSEVFELGK